MRLMSVIFLAVVAVAIVAVASENKGNEVQCTCAVFGHKGHDKRSGVPLLTKVVKINAGCDENGATECGLHCKEMAEISARRENQDLCRAIRDTDDPLRPSIYSKVCDAKLWTYAGLTASRDYCCVEGKHDICDMYGK